MAAATHQLNEKVVCSTDSEGMIWYIQCPPSQLDLKALMANNSPCSSFICPPWFLLLENCAEDGRRLKRSACIFGEQKVSWHASCFLEKASFREGRYRPSIKKRMTWLWAWVVRRYHLNHQEMAAACVHENTRFNAFPFCTSKALRWKSGEARRLPFWNGLFSEAGRKLPVGVIQFTYPPVNKDSNDQ